MMLVPSSQYTQSFTRERLQREFAALCDKDKRKKKKSEFCKRILSIVTSEQTHALYVEESFLRYPSYPVSFYRRVTSAA